MGWLFGHGGGRPGRSAEVASERLQLVLKYDRARLPPGLVDVLKDELLNVLRRYLDVVEEGIEVSFSAGDRRLEAPMALVANVPVRGPRRAAPSPARR
ncbi:MAG TPA: cell division topological specificity factor MinE [Limnochordales bacterium]